MDEEALVERLVAEGARLEFALARRVPSARSSKSIVALDAGLGEWQILLPLPEGASRLGIYSTLQDIIRELELSLTVDRIVLVKKDDPGLQELRGSISPYARHGATGQGPVEVAGRLFVEPRELRVDPQLLERKILDLLRAELEEDIFVETGVELSRPSREEEYAADYASPRVLRLMRYADVVAFGQDSILLVEVKTPRHPAPLSMVLSSFGLLSYFRRLPGFPQNVGMIFVSASGFMPQVERELGQFNDFYLVSWGDAAADSRIVDLARRTLHI